MHEWALALAVIKSVLENKEKNNLKELTEVTVILGELQQIDKDIFDSALKEIAVQEHLPTMEIIVESQEALFGCRKCGYEWNFKDAVDKLDEEQSEFIHFIPDVAPVYIKCPKCKSSDFHIKQGRGVSISKIKGIRHGSKD